MADFIGGTATAVTKSVEVANFVQASLRQASLLLPTIRDFSSLAIAGRSGVSIPKKSNEFVVNKLDNPLDNDSNCPAPQVVTYTEDTLNFDCTAHVGFQIPLFCEIQSKVNLTAEAISDAAWAHGDDIDKGIYADLFAGANVANDVSDAGDILTNIFCCEEALRSCDVPYTLGDIFYTITPAGKKALMTSTTIKIIDASVYGGQMPLVKGEIGMLGGARLILTNNADPLKNTKLGLGAPIMGQMMYHRNALGFAMQAGPIVKSLEDPDCMTTKYGIAQLYGKKIMCDGKYVSKVII